MKMALSIVSMLTALTEHNSAGLSLHKCEKMGQMDIQ